MPEPISWALMIMGVARVGPCFAASAALRPIARPDLARPQAAALRPSPPSAC